MLELGPIAATGEEEDAMTAEEVAFGTQIDHVIYWWGKAKTVQFCWDVLASPPYHL